MAFQAHALETCPVPGSARLDLAALGDFPVTERTSASLAINAAGTELAFPITTQAVQAKASSDLANQSFIGYGQRLADRFDFLLWPEASPCELFRPGASDSFPGKIGGEALGFSDSTGLVMVAGSNDATSAAIVGALTFDTQTGITHVVDPRARAVLSEPRAFATVSDFDGKVLVAGGEDPIHDVSQPASVLRSTAEVYDPTAQSFEPDLVALAEAITEHAAATLADGETVLLGGRDELHTASNFVQVISPKTRNTHLIDALNVARNAPTALRLDDGRIFVAGGSDETGQPIGALEWRAADASKLAAPFDGSVALPPRYDRAFATLPGGAVLAVGGCEERSPQLDEDCSTWCKRGCPPTPDSSSKQSYDAFWVAADGSVSAIDFPWSAPLPLLIPGSDGRPWLIAAGVDATGAPVPSRFALYRFDPWRQTFAAISVDLSLSQSLNPARLTATGPDAFAWLEANNDGPVLRGARFGTRSSFSNDIALVSVRDSADAARPAHLAPDHQPAASVSYDGTLVFAKRASAAAATCVWITDAVYADFSVQIDFSGPAPTLRLGPQDVSASNLQSASTCALPTAGTQGERLTLTRVGSKLSLNIGRAQTSCDLDVPERVPFGMCQSELGSTTVTAVNIQRGD